MNVGQRVVLNVPENERVHGKYATIETLTEWGAHVTTDATSTGKFRALFEEMEEIVSASTNGVHKGELYTADGKRETTTKQSARNMGYTGNICINCQGSKMRRNGTCEVCEDCGSTNGCS